MIGDGESVDPGECLRDRLDLNEVEREAGFPMDEACAEGLVGVVEVDGGGVETVGFSLFGDVGEGGGVGGGAEGGQ